MEINSNNIQLYIKKAQLGEQGAFTFILDFYWNEVYGFMIKRTENETDTEDIVIETFSKAFDKITTYNSDFGFNTWLIAIAKNVHIDMLRKKKSSLFIENDDESNYHNSIADDTPSAEDKLIIEQNLAQLLLCIKELKPSYQEIIQMRYFQEMSYQEIADYLNIPLHTIKIKLLRGKKLLAEIISKKQST
ncbi:MAG TPA: RNA polymerase subunit sigma-70 [Flavobacterium sp.]|nr:RNA polymerase subunit sigma-70 [Flavobacterium sp.]